MTASPTKSRSGAVFTPKAERPRFRGLSHLLAFAGALTAAPLLILNTPGVGQRFIVAIYALAVVALFGVSAAYHRGDWGERSAGFMRRLDHSMIFVLIAATYTPIAVFALPTSTAQWVLPVVWGGAIVGIVGRLAWAGAPYPVVAVPYLLVGWVGVVALGDILDSLGVAGFVLIVTGGGLFTIGALIYALHRPNPWPKWFGYHEIFHLFVIGGVAVHYVAVAYFAVPQA
ncbi:MAG: hemolysin III [Candidatus Poriferisodalaceae bacterium]|jgi:hemolysin III